MNVLRMGLFILLLSSFISCSQVRKWKDGFSGEETETGLASELDEGVFDDDDEVAAGDGAEDLDGVELAEDETVDQVMDKAKEAAEEYEATESRSMASESAAGPEGTDQALRGEEMEYVVQENDTLMWISFKLYGNYLRWREILETNPGLSTELSAGTKIKYRVPSEEFNWKPGGRPYLIVVGDTLGVISGKVYGTVKKWESIWNNNRPMIKDPNLIFAGFTIYYLEGEKLALNDNQDGE